MLLTLVLVLVCILLYRLNRENENYWKRRKVTFEKPLPILGNILDVLLLRKSFGKKIRDLYFKFDQPFFGIWLFNKPQLVIKDPDLIKQILVKDFDNFCDRNITCDERIDEFSANMTFFMKNPKWKTIRTKTTALFTSTKLKTVYPEIQTIAEDMVQYISSTKGNVLDTKDICNRYANEAICSATFGVDSYSFRSNKQPLITIAKSAFGITIGNVISMCSHLGRNALVNIFKLKLVNSSVATFLRDFFLEIVEKRKAYNGGKKIFMDFLIKLNEESNLCDNELVGQAAQFLIAGHETISSTLSIAIYELAINKSIQDKLRAEVRLFLEADGSISYASLSTMNYLDKVIYETLRKYPVIPFLGRTCMKNYKVPHSAIVIEKGVDVLISLAGLHNDPKYFPNPELFEPERFSEENIRRRHPYCYLPFGEGQRSCIGQRMGMLLTKLALAHIIKTFDIEICNKTKVPMEFTKKSLTMSINGEVYLKFEKID